MSVDRLQPEIIVFAGPNGSGKSTVTKLAKTAGIYINADDIKRANHCSDLEAAQRAEMMRENALEQMQDFTFETVLSTDRNLRLLQRAREKGYFIRCFYVLTADPDINVARVNMREMQGGHGVPENKVRLRYDRALKLIRSLSRYAMSCIYTTIHRNRSEFSKKEKPFIFTGQISTGIQSKYAI